MIARRRTLKLITTLAVITVCSIGLLLFFDSLDRKFSAPQTSDKPIVYRGDTLVQFSGAASPQLIERVAVETCGRNYSLTVRDDTTSRPPIIVVCRRP